MTTTNLRRVVPYVDVTRISELHQLYDTVVKQITSSEQFFDRLLEELSITYSVHFVGLSEQSFSGALVVANHPTGLLDGVILASLLQRQGMEYVIFANAILQPFEHISARLALLNVDLTDLASVHRNALTIKRAVRTLSVGGACGIFPAGEVASYSLSERAPAEADWRLLPAFLIQRLQCRVIPVHFHAQNSVSFYALGLISKRLRFPFLARELLNKRGLSFHVTVGPPLEAANLCRLGSYQAISKALRAINMDLRGAF